MASLPSRERGLKYTMINHRMTHHTVAPLEGARIEMTTCILEITGECRSPRGSED